MSDAQPHGPSTLLGRLSAQVGLDPLKYYDAVRTMCGCDEATNGHFMALLVAAEKYGLDPLQKQIVLTKNIGKVSVTVPIDGWITIIRRNADYLAHDLAFTWKPGAPQSRDSAIAGNLYSATVTFHTKRRTAAGLPPKAHTEYFSECYVPPRAKRDGAGLMIGPWQTHPIRMLGWKAMIQGAREEFGMYVPDRDEVGTDVEPQRIEAPVAAVALPAPSRVPTVIETVACAPEPEPVAVPVAESEWSAEKSRELDKLAAETERPQ